MLVAKPDTTKQSGQDHKATQLNRTTPDVIDQEDRYPVTGNVSRTREDQVAHSSIVQAPVHVAA